jgi:hypothetical protein
LAQGVGKGERFGAQGGEEAVVLGGRLEGKTITDGRREKKKKNRRAWSSNERSVISALGG